VNEGNRHAAVDHGAERLIGTTPADCYLCLRMRGDIAVARGDWPAVERWFTEATRLGPSMSFAYADWGRARLAHGDVEGAMTVLTRAHQAGPRFADPLELTGEALMRRSDWDRAADKFRAAAELAPAWGRIHLKWGESLLGSGRERPARAQLALARNLYLTAGERAEIDGLPK
jgi:tetratricopeptide (TPR) repeat protein